MKRSSAAFEVVRQNHVSCSPAIEAHLILKKGGRIGVLMLLMRKILNENATGASLHSGDMQSNYADVIGCLRAVEAK